MMISPYSYREEQAKKTYKELLKERKELLKKIIEFENNLDEPDGNDVEIISPSPEVVYQCNLQYLSELCDLIAEKYNHEYIGIR